MEKEIKKIKQDALTKLQNISEDEQKLRISISEAVDKTNELRDKEESLNQRDGHQRSKEDRVKQQQQAAATSLTEAHAKEQVSPLSTYVPKNFANDLSQDYNKKLEGLEMQHKSLRTAEATVKREMEAIKEEEQNMHTMGEKLNEREKETRAREAATRKVEHEASEKFLHAQREMEAATSKHKAIDEREVLLKKRDEDSRAHIDSLRCEANELMNEARRQLHSAEVAAQNLKRAEARIEDEKTQVQHLRDRAKEQVRRAHRQLTKICALNYCFVRRRSTAPWLSKRPRTRRCTKQPSRAKSRAGSWQTQRAR